MTKTWPILIEANIPMSAFSSEQTRNDLITTIYAALEKLDVEVKQIRSREIMAPDPLWAPLDGTAE